MNHGGERGFEPEIELVDRLGEGREEIGGFLEVPEWDLGKETSSIAWIDRFTVSSSFDSIRKARAEDFLLLQEIGRYFLAFTTIIHCF